jgi:putative hemolysin
MHERSSAARELGGSKGLFRLPRPSGSFGRHPFRHTAIKIIERLAGLHELSGLYAQIPRTLQGATFIDSAIRQLGIRYELVGSNIDAIPASGPLLVVANHPFGGVEGLIACKLLLGARSDVKLLGNELLGHVPQFRSLLSPLHIAGSSSQAVRTNGTSLRGASRWLHEGHALIVFPAGDVAHYRGPCLGITDPAWDDVVGWLIRQSNANVLPIYFAGFNTITFQLFGVLHPVVRSVMMVRELVNKRGKLLHVALGLPVEVESLKSLSDYRTLTGYLRQVTYALRVELTSIRTKNSRRSSDHYPVS